MYMWLRNGIGKADEHGVWRIKDLKVEGYATHRVDWIVGGMHRVE